LELMELLARILLVSYFVCIAYLSLIQEIKSAIQSKNFSRRSISLLLSVTVTIGLSAAIILDVKTAFLGLIVIIILGRQAYRTFSEGLPSNVASISPYEWTPRLKAMMMTSVYMSMVGGFLLLVLISLQRQTVG
jgi:hypothetical protein